ncbi:MAG: hypothetical protein ACK4RK_15640 [Gemmataceae bacterium]
MRTVFLWGWGLLALWPLGASWGEDAAPNRAVAPPTTRAARGADPAARSDPRDVSRAGTDRLSVLDAARPRATERGDHPQRDDPSRGAARRTERGAAPRVLVPTRTGQTSRLQPTRSASDQRGATRGGPASNRASDSRGARPERE